MLRPPGKVLGALTLAVLLGQAFLVMPGIPWLDWRDEFTGLGFFLNLLLPALFLASGRVVLAFLPPGDVGARDARGLPVTLAVSAVIGSLATLPLDDLVPSYLPVYALVLALALLRWSTLPGAMVPRYAVQGEPFGRLDALLALAGVVWSMLLLLTEDGVQAFLWLALGLLLFHGLGVARRRRFGRYAILGLAALAFVPLGAYVSIERMPPALSLALGATFFIGWSRRADRRAGALAGIGFGSLFLGGADPLAFAGALVFVLASRPRQRPFALAWVGGSAALALALTCLGPRPLPEPRGRLMLANELGFQLELWGLAWPAVFAAIALGVLSFAWRSPEWRPQTIEEPRREARALAALLASSVAALAVPLSPWFEADALVILFPPCALLAGLLLIPAETLPASD